MSQLQTIDDLSDARLQPFRDLRRRRSTRPDDVFVVEGQLVVQRLLASPLHVDSIVVEAGKHQWVDAWRERCPIFRLSKPLIRQLAGFDFHRGVLAAARRPPQIGLAEILADTARGVVPGDAVHLPEPRRMASGGLGPMLLFVCGVSDKENLGSLIRTATAFGITDIVCDRSSADPYATRVLRVSMGTAFKQRLLFSDDVVEDVRRLSQVAGYRTIATTLKPGAVDLHCFARQQLNGAPPIALLIGSEADGLSEEVERVATDRVTIPMQRQTDSLNVSIATGIVLYAIVSGTMR